MDQPPSRMQRLQKMLQQQPNDPFLLYALALEHKNAGELDRAIEMLDQTVAADSGYCYAYFQKGQIYEEQKNHDAARQAYQQGIEAAIKRGDNHARSELETALSELG